MTLDQIFKPRSAAILFAVLGALLLVVGLFAARQTAKLDAADARLNAMTQKAIYETCELTEGLAVNLRKLQVAGDAGQAQALLSAAALQTQGALGNLALLPVGQDTVTATMKFINQAGDFASTLSARLGRGGKLTDADYATLASLAESAAAFSTGMGALLTRYERGEAVFSAADGAQAEGDLAPLSNPAAEYPALLYDGPFSDGRTDGEYKALADLNEVDEPAARAALATFLDVDPSDIAPTGESAIPVPCYEFALKRGGYALSAGVTKAGARVLYLLCEDDVQGDAVSPDAAIEAAQTFLAERGYGEMAVSYSSRFGGILTVNFAAVQDGILLYPDLVKVQISLADGTVVGLEAAGYLMNHVPRQLPAPALTEQEAMARVGAKLTPQGARLCVIPTDAGEALCYEVRATSGGDAFLCYIDALTGAERELMQVVDEPGGTMVM